MKKKKSKLLDMFFNQRPAKSKHTIPKIDLKAHLVKNPSHFRTMIQGNTLVDYGQLKTMNFNKY